MAQKGRKESPIPCGETYFEYLDLKRKIADGLEKKHLKLIRFLCANYIPRSVELTSGFDLMHYLEKRHFIHQHDVSFLVEILFQIQRYDLIKTVPGIPNRTYFENEILSGLHYFEEQKYRNFIVQLENQLSADDFKDFKSRCAELAHSQNLDRAEYVVDILQKLEELDLVHDDNFSLLLMILKELKAKGPYQELKRIHDNNNDIVNEEEDENRGRDAEIPSGPGTNENSSTLPEDASTRTTKTFSVPNSNQPDYEAPLTNAPTVNMGPENSMPSSSSTIISDVDLTANEKPPSQEGLAHREQSTAGQTEACSSFDQIQSSFDEEMRAENESHTEQSTRTENVLAENGKSNPNSSTTQGFIPEEINYQPKATGLVDDKFLAGREIMQEKEKHKAASRNLENITSLILKPESEAGTARNIKLLLEQKSNERRDMHKRPEENAVMKHFTANSEHATPLMPEPAIVPRNTGPVSERSKQIAEITLVQNKKTKGKIGPVTSEQSAPLTSENKARCTCNTRAITGSKPVKTLVVVFNEKDFPRFKPTPEECKLWEKCGLCLPLLDLKERAGSDYDVDNLSHILKNCEGVDVCSYDNLTTSSILELLKEISQGRVERGKHRNLAEYDRFLLFILTHGETGWIYGVDGFRIALSELVELFLAEKCPILANKPKVLFPIACRDGNRSEELHSEYSRLNEMLSQETNLVVIYPTKLFCTSDRWTKEGTVFVIEFVKAFKECPGKRNLEGIIGVAAARLIVKYNQFPKFLGRLAENFSFILDDDCCTTLNDDNKAFAGAVRRTQNK